MPAIFSTAPGKAILFGEHAVVYNRPAIAVPVNKVQAKSAISADPGAPSGRVSIIAPRINLNSYLYDLPEKDPIATAIRLTLHALGLERLPACQIRITSTIPVASGLGSGAAVSVALVRSLAAFVGQTIPDEIVSEISFEVEKIHHGTPSGIDNTVVTYSKPVYFRRGHPLETFAVPEPFTILIADTGVPSPTSNTVGDVRRSWENEPSRYEAIFEEIGEIVEQARQVIQTGQPWALGKLMDANHAFLQQLSVSSIELDRLVDASREAGASGAKLSGGGRGGNMIALVDTARAEQVTRALLDNGAVGVIMTVIGA
jgi:mevalonate kinase